MKSKSKYNFEKSIIALLNKHGLNTKKLISVKIEMNVKSIPIINVEYLVE